jgi:hypothetical protein
MLIIIILFIKYSKNEFVKLISKSMSDESSTANERTIETLQNELIHFRDRVNFKINVYLDY